MFKEFASQIQLVNLKKSINSTISFSILREDLNHNLVSGNKLRKLKYNLIEAKKRKKDGLISFGGRYSNHIHALASAGKIYGFKTKAIIRGDEKIDLNSTLEFAHSCGMELVFVSREEYKNRGDENYLNLLSKKYPNYFIIPEGGTNTLALKGCKEILNDITKEYNYICCACGTGGTLAGLALSASNSQQLIGFNVLKNRQNLLTSIKKMVSTSNYTINNNYHFGGYAKVNEELIKFINNFYELYSVKLDAIYTGKAMYGILDLIKKNFFPAYSKVLFVHTGGLQGNKGIEELKGVKLPS